MKKKTDFQYEINVSTCESICLMDNEGTLLKGKHIVNEEKRTASCQELRQVLLTTFACCINF